MIADASEYLILISTFVHMPPRADSIGWTEASISFPEPPHLFTLCKFCKVGVSFPPDPCRSSGKYQVWREPARLYW